MKYWLISDTHFGHRNMERLCNRPPDFEDRICKAWKKNVGLFDAVIHLGDVCFRYKDADAHTNWVQDLPGKKILVRGNHDKKPNSWYVEHGWDFSCDSFQMRYEEFDLRFVHVPPFNETFVGIDLNLGNIRYICGHQHQNVFHHPEIDKYQYVISLEHQGYSPQPLNQVLRSFRKCAIL